MADNVFLIKGPVTNADIRKMMAELMFTFMDSTETSGKVMAGCNWKEPNLWI